MSDIFIGLMSGTSLDGVDAVAVRFDNGRMALLGEAFVSYPLAVREQVLALQQVADNELDRSARLGNELAQLYAAAVQAVLQHAGLAADQVQAVACHGQTIRHAPQAGYTLQIGNLALLAELTGIDVIGDLRSRDVAAGGQGAPLVPAFHQAMFASPATPRAILNIGGIANLTRLQPDAPVIGFDTGPGNMLLDAWIRHHRNQDYDADGAWAASGHCNDALLQILLAEPYFSAGVPKSTGRDLFSLEWLAARLERFRLQHGDIDAANVQATLLALSAHSIADAVTRFAPATRELYLCGGGVRNGALCRALAALLPGVQIAATDALGLPAQQVEAAAFAWLGWRFCQRAPGNLPQVTGASGLRVLGALYPH
ncbi:anhydro-N-acetylmuramic acid kinase [Vogesella sp. LIG4]|uniref:anhydro-N-acetylmuramic acid kinase n=1 Tax=Vogesella sp. LIG4 TaxID=1192162 RepID=UPI00081F858C|nr:anhydro-N-acetylmuramic acid kinase [Vogesella sp. LIG4]SCK25377.1 anhydro-N-acetylmuramic acid kinase [Vogesella sp. LIG4]